MFVPITRYKFPWPVYSYRISTEATWEANKLDENKRQKITRVMRFMSLDFILRKRKIGKGWVKKENKRKHLLWEVLPG
jgi:hypothetical protein